MGFSTTTSPTGLDTHQAKEAGYDHTVSGPLGVVLCASAENCGSTDSNQDDDVRQRTRLRSGSNDGIPCDNSHGEGNSGQVFKVEYDNGYSIDTPMSYYASAALTTNIAGLFDGGTNGGLVNPRVMTLLCYTCPERYVNITGVGNLQIPRLKIGTFAANVHFMTAVQLQDGRYVLLIFHEYGELPIMKCTFISHLLRFFPTECCALAHQALREKNMSLAIQEHSHVTTSFRLLFPRKGYMAVYYHCDIVHVCSILPFQVTVKNRSPDLSSQLQRTRSRTTIFDHSRSLGLSPELELTLNDYPHDSATHQLLVVLLLHGPYDMPFAVLQHPSKGYFTYGISNLNAREKPQILILWESGGITSEPITAFYKDNPWLLSAYAKEKGLIEEWEKQCPRLKIAKHAENSSDIISLVEKSSVFLHPPLTCLHASPSIGSPPMSVHCGSLRLQPYDMNNTSAVIARSLIWYAVNFSTHQRHMLSATKLWCEYGESSNFLAHPSPSLVMTSLAYDARVFHADWGVMDLSSIIRFINAQQHRLISQFSAQRFDNHRYQLTVWGGYSFFPSTIGYLSLWALRTSLIICDDGIICNDEKFCSSLICVFQNSLHKIIVMSRYFTHKFNAPYMSYCEENGEYTSSEASAYFQCQEAFTLGSILDLELYYISVLSSSCDIRVVSSHAFYYHMSTMDMTIVSAGNHLVSGTCQDWLLIVMNSVCWLHPSIWDLLDRIFYVLYKVERKVFSFQHGKILRPSHRLMYALWLCGDSSCVSCVLPAQDLILIGVKRILFHNLDLISTFSRQDTASLTTRVVAKINMWTAINSISSVTAKDVYVNNTSNTHGVFWNSGEIRNELQLRKLALASYGLCRDSPSQDTFPVIQELEASFYSVHYCQVNVKLLSTTRNLPQYIDYSNGSLRRHVCSEPRQISPDHVNRGTSLSEYDQLYDQLQVTCELQVTTGRQVTDRSLANEHTRSSIDVQPTSLWGAITDTIFEIDFYHDPLMIFFHILLKLGVLWGAISHASASWGVSNMRKFHFRYVANTYDIYG